MVPEPVAPDGGPPQMPRGTSVTSLIQFLARPHMHAVIFQIGALGPGPLRFQAIKEALEISQNTLSTRLKELVSAGLVQRTAFDEIPPRVEYAPTEKLLKMIPVFVAMHEWCDVHELERAQDQSPP